MKFHTMGKMNEYIKLNEKASDLNWQVSVFASRGAMLLAFGAFITLSIIKPFSIINIWAGVCVINTIFDNFFAERFLGHKIKYWVDVYCVGFLMATVPIQWFGTGGFYGVGPIWAIFAVAYCVYGISGRIQLLLLMIFSIEVAGILFVNAYFTVYVAAVSNVEQIVMVSVSLCAVGLYILVLQLLQHREFLKDRIALTELQENLTAHYEETISVNEDLLNTAERLEMANKTQRSFTASMNHELRTPLNGIEGCLQILLMDESISVESRETVRQAITASKTMIETVNDLLDFAKLDEGKFEIMNKPFDLRDILDNITTIFRPQASAKNLKFHIQIPKESRVYLVADGVRIQQIMTNLISNGIKYTHEGSVVMTITTQRGHLLFDVQDTGQGMSEENLKVLFDPFTRFNSEENINIQGTGLGMNIVASLVKEMQGTISVESQVGVGTIFHVDIPIMFYDSDVTYMSEREIVSIENSKIDFANYRVLCVDDTEINRAVFKGLLKKSGAHVAMAGSGQKAISLCEEQDFDIIFLDHQMPEMDGIETMHKIRGIKDGRFANTPIVMFTGNAGPEYKEMYTREGASGYLLKPIMYEDLIACFKVLEA